MRTRQVTGLVNVLAGRSSQEMSRSRNEEANEYHNLGRLQGAVSSILEPQFRGQIVSRMRLLPIQRTLALPAKQPA